MSFLPLPNLWSSEIGRLERRLRIDACDAAVRGAFEMMDQIFVDIRPDRVLRSATEAAATAAAAAVAATGNATTNETAAAAADISMSTAAAATIMGLSPPLFGSPSLHFSTSPSMHAAAAAAAATFPPATTTAAAATLAVPTDGWLVRLAANPPLQEALVVREGLPPPTLRALLAEHHLQGALKRHGTGITVDAAVAAQVR